MSDEEDKKPKLEEEDQKPSTSQDGQRSENSPNQLPEAQEEGLHHSEEAPLVVGSFGQDQEESRGVGEARLNQDSFTQHDHLAVLMRIEKRLGRVEQQIGRVEQQVGRVEQQVARVEQLQASQRRQWILRQLLKWSLHILAVVGIVATYVVYAGKDFSTFISLFIIIFFSSKATWLLCEAIDDKMRRRSTRHVK